jgi:hypothetical protein
MQYGYFDDQANEYVITLLEQMADAWNMRIDKLRSQ